MRRWALFVLLTTITAMASGGVARAAEITVLTAGAMRGVVDALVPEFERQSGSRVRLDNATAGVLRKRIEEGEAFDVAIITSTVLAALAAEGKVVPGSVTALAKVGIGVVVREGAVLPDIGTLEAFKQTLLGAKSVAYIDPKAGGTTGIYFDRLLERLAIAEQVRAKAKLKDGGHVADLVASGEAELGVHVISEIVPVKGVTLVGPLPAEVQHTTVYAAGVASGARDAAAAAALIALLAAPAVAAILKDKGMERP
jgi:molybdate transport system substrate-binding protein